MAILKRKRSSLKNQTHWSILSLLTRFINARNVSGALQAIIAVTTCWNWESSSFDSSFLNIFSCHSHIKKYGLLSSFWKVFYKPRTVNYCISSQNECIASFRKLSAASILYYISQLYLFNENLGRTICWFTSLNLSFFRKFPIYSLVAFFCL